MLLSTILSRDPPSEISPLPPSRIPSDNDRLNANTESMPSSIEPFAMKLMIWTGRAWPSKSQANRDDVCLSRR